MKSIVEVGGGMWEEPEYNADNDLRRPDSGFSHIPRPTSTV